MVWVLVIGVGLPLLRGGQSSRGHERGEAVLGQPRAFASVTLPSGPPSRPVAVASEAPTLPPPAPEKRSALVIGVNHAPGHSALQGAVTDAINLQKALVAYGFPEANVVTLTEGQATAGRILSELDRLAARSPADGRAVFAFAGHTRMVGSVPHFVAGDGGLIAAGTIAAKLARVRAPMWVALPTCYAGAYALPGIIGPNRIATFSSAADSVTYELGPAGSWLILYMVEYAMLEGEAPRSVESSFAYARAAIGRVNENRVPFMVDRIPGDFVLGTLGPPAGGEAVSTPPGGDGVTQPSNDANSGVPADDSQQSGGSSRGPVMVCRGVRFGCPSSE
jgi:hypothetical protein